MSTDADTELEDRLAGTLRIGVGLSGLVALIVGVLILVWPEHSAQVVAAIVAIYAILVGLGYLATATFARAQNVWVRVGNALVGVFFVIAAIIAFVNLRATTVVLAAVIAITVGILWILEAGLLFATLGTAPKPGWALFSAIISLIAGVLLLLSPLWGAAVLWLFVGIALVVIGVVQIVRAFRIGR